MLLSALSVLMCVSMLVGSTFAWFTDSVTSGINKIVAGNLDIELEYYNGTEWLTVENATDLFSDENWEPGHAEVVYLKLSNLGSLDLKYQLGINIDNEISSVSVVNDEPFKLSDFILFSVVDGINGETAAFASRDAAIEAARDVTDGNKALSTQYFEADRMEAGQAPVYMALVLYIPKSVGNEMNFKKGAAVPTIDLGIKLVATQLASEEDSFGSDYDKDAWHPEMIIFTTDDLQAALEYGTDAQLGADIAVNDNVVLTANLDLGGKTLSAGSITATEDVEIINGTLVMPEDNKVYAQNGVTITLEDVVIDSDKISAYAGVGGTLVMNDVVFENTATSNPIQNYGGTLVMDNVTVAQSGDANTAWYSSAVQVINLIKYNAETGKYEILSQANTTINGGTYTGKKAVMISAPGGNVTINGGTFVGSEYAIQADFSPQNYTYGENYESVITINGGNFTGNIRATAAAKVVITGGNFSVDPTAYLAEGYIAVANADGTYTVKIDAVTGSDLIDKMKDPTATTIIAGENIDLNDTTYRDSSTMNSFTVKDGKTLNLNENSFVRPDGGSGSGIIIPANATTTVKNGSVVNEGDMTAVDIAVGACATFDHVDFVGNGDSMIRLRASNTAKTTIIFKDCTFKNAGVELAGMNGACEIDVQFIGCTFEGTYKMYDENGNALTDKHGHVHYTKKLISASSNYLFGNITFDTCTLDYDASEYRYTNSNGVIELSGTSNSYNETITLTLKNVTVSCKNALPVKYTSSAYKKNIVFVEEGTNTYTNNGVLVNHDGSAK